MKKILYYIIIILIIIILALIYSRFIGTTGFTVHEHIIKSNKIADSYDGIKILHFSDIHYKKIVNKERIKEIIKEINKLKPDIVLFTGDLVDNKSNLSNKDINFLIRELSKIQSTYGNYSIIGDNDYNKLEIVKNIFIQSNFNLLENENSIIFNENNDKLFIGGISTSTYKKANINKVMNNINDNNYKIIMIHEGDYIDKILDKHKDIDLIVAGHSINGSINIIGIKNILTPNGSKKYYKPYYKVNNTNIYVSNGIGVNNINFRLNNTPSINLYRIKKQPQ